MTLRTDWVDGADTVDDTALNLIGTDVNANTAAVANKTSGPASAADNAVARYDGTTGKLLQNSSATISDDGLISTTVANGNGLSVTTSKGVGAAENLVYLEATNAAWDRPLLRINDSSTAGGAANIRIDSPNPDIEFVETDQTAPAGKFEIAVNSDSLQINGRNAADNSFEPIAMFRRYASGGTLGIGTQFDTPQAMVEIVKVTGKNNLAVSTAVASSGDIVNIAEAGGVVINDRGAAVDVRVEGDTDQNLLFTKGSTDRVGIGTASPAQKLDVVGNATVSGTLSVGGGEVSPTYDFLPTDHGYKAWAYDPIIATSGSLVATGGQANTVLVKVPVATTITNIVLYISTGPGTLTNSYVALYNFTGTLLSQSATLNASWNTSGVKVCPLGAAQPVAAGLYRVVFWATVSAGALPTIWRAASQSTNNANLSGNNIRFGTADGSLTTTAPSTLGTISTTSVGAWWVALS